MKLIKIIKENFFTSLILLAYILLFIIRPDLGLASVKNSGYYIKEMLLIMPVIFVLTALLDLWVPKEKIMQYLGKDAKAKGVILAFVLGSISAGPIYAAFPMCVMLHKKGASIRNLVVILSSWAVIKIPMLLNEVKFLGLKFMLVRWFLTVIAILVFSWITGKIVKDKDLPDISLVKSGISINKGACVGCSLCSSKYPAVFTLKKKKASIKKYTIELDKDRLEDTIQSCPFKAISYTE